MKSALCTVNIVDDLFKFKSVWQLNVDCKNTSRQLFSEADKTGGKTWLTG